MVLIRLCRALLDASSSMTRDPNAAKSLPPHSHVLVTPTASVHPAHSPRYPTKPLGRDEYSPGHDFDKETETDHGYESTTTTTDSDPPPHTPIGTATTSHCVEALQIHGDDEVEVDGVEIDEAHGAIRLSDPTTPVKLPDRFSMSTSPSLSAGSVDSHQEGCESSKAAVVFPSLNGTFCQGSSSQVSTSLSSPGMSSQTTPAGTVTPVSSSSLSSAKESAIQPDEEDSKKTERKSGGLEAAARSVLGDGPAFMLSLSSPPLTSPGRGLRKDSQGFWEPVTAVSPSSSSSSLPLSPSEGKMRPGHSVGWTSNKTGSVPRESSEPSEVASSPSTLSAKSRSLSPGPCRVTGAGSARSPTSWPTSFSSPTSTSASVSGGSYPSSPSPPNGSSLIPPNTTPLLPAFLVTTTVKRKKTSRTREIVDRLRSSSLDAGKGGAGLDDLGWLASPTTSDEQDGMLGKATAGLDHAAGNHVAGGQPSPSSSPSSQSSADLASRVGSDRKKDGQVLGSKACDAGSSGSRGKSNKATQGTVPGSDTHTNSRTATATATPGITPFPILSVSQMPASNTTITRQSQAGGTGVRDTVYATPSKNADKVNASVTMSPNARNPGLQLVPGNPNGGTSPSARAHHPLPSPTHPTVHPLPQPPLGPPPPMLAISGYPHPHPVYVPFTQYHIPPPQQGQGAWVAIYPGRPPHVPMHPLPAPHVPPITGVSGMRHVSW